MSDLELVKSQLPDELSRASTMLGWTIEDVNLGEKSVVVSFQATEQFTNPIGLVQGGILTAMMDDTMGPAVVIATGGEKFPTSTDIHTQFFKGAHPGKLICTARVTKLGRSMAFTAAELRNAEGDLLCSAIQTAKLVALDMKAAGEAGQEQGE